jgi:hypothetical protein
MLAITVRQQLFRAGETVTICHIGGVFRSGYLMARFKQLLELAEGCRPEPPRYGPAAGALIEAYRAAGMHPVLSGGRELER